MKFSDRFLFHARLAARSNNIDGRYFRWYGKNYYSCVWYNSILDKNLFSISQVRFLQSGHIVVKVIYEIEV